MQIIAVDNNQQDLGVLNAAVQALFPNSTVTGFTDPLMAIKFCMDHDPDLILCEQDLKRLDGFSLIKTLRQRFPRLRGVLLANRDKWRQDAENLMLGYAVKPVTVDKLRTALQTS